MLFEEHPTFYGNTHPIQLSEGSQDHWYKAAINLFVESMEHLDSHLRSFWKWGRGILTARTTSPPDHVDYVFSFSRFS